MAKMSSTVAYHIESLLRTIDLVNAPSGPVVHKIREQIAEHMGRLVREQAAREGLNG